MVGHGQVWNILVVLMHFLCLLYQGQNITFLSGDVNIATRITHGMAGSLAATW